MNYVKEFNRSLITPCKEVLLLKVKRVHLIAKYWALTIVAQPPDGKPEEFGWTFSNDGRYIIKWCEGSAAPRVLDLSVSEDTEPSTENDIEGTYKAIAIQVCFCGKLK